MKLKSSEFDERVRGSRFEDDLDVRHGDFKRAGDYLVSEHPEPLDRVREVANWDLTTLTIGTMFGLVMGVMGFPVWVHHHSDLAWWQFLVDAATHFAGFLFFLHQADKALGCWMARVGLRRIEGGQR
jgi:hypothetical protein